MHDLSPVLQAKLLLILHRAFVEARNLALIKNTEHLYQLADAFEVIPELMARQGARSLAQVRAILQEYQERQADSGYDYLSLLDMDDVDFQSIHLGTPGAVENLA